MIDSADRIAFWQHETFLIGLRRQSCGAAPILGGGDSLIAATTGVFGGRALFNTGLSGGRVQTITERICPMLPGSESAAAVLLVGMNNALIEDATDPELVDFYQHYNDLCWTITRSIPRLMVMSIPPIESGKWGDLLGVSLPTLTPDVVRRRILMLNDAILNIAQTWGYGYFELNGMMRGADYYAMPGSTIDGVHFSQATYGALLPRLDTAVTQLLARTPGTFWQAQL